MRQIAFNLQSGGGRDNDNLQPQKPGSTQYPPAKDHAAQDSIFSNMRQIAINLQNGVAIALVVSMCKTGVCQVIPLLPADIRQPLL